MQLKAETDGSASYAALEKKAQLYEKLARGELSDEDEREKYNVDFLRKGYLEDEFKQLESEGREEKCEMREDGSPEVSIIDRRTGIGWNTDKVGGITREHKLLVRYEVFPQQMLCA